MASSLSRTPSGSGNQRTWTYSGWFKFCTTDQNLFLLSAGAYGDSKSMQLLIANSGNFLQFQGFSSGGSADFNCETNAELRDIGAWYHIMVACDTTQSTASDRAKIYINGELQTLRTSTYPSQNYDTGVNTAIAHEINDRPGASLEQTLYSTHVHMTDGTAYAASTFGETDSTSGIWKPKTAPSVTYGTNGFFLKMENSGAMGTDSSGNSNTFTVNGTITQAEDTPSNNFATFNPLKDGRINSGTQYKATFSNGNTTSTFSESTYNTGAFSSLAVMGGKWYAEIKCSNKGGNTKLGLFSADDYGSDDFSGTYLYDSSGTFGGASYGSSFTTGDIIQIAFDSTNGNLWFGKNGTWQNSATQSEIEAGTTTNAAATGISTTEFWHFGTYGVNATAFQANFGNGRYGTTALSSSNSDGAGLGLFEYSVPSGYYSLCTKNIKDYG